MSEAVVIDHFDSFTYNLVDYLEEHLSVTVMRNDCRLGQIEAEDPSLIVLSPGPGRPENPRDAGITLEVIRRLTPDIPTFGVCFGLESAVYAHGGRIVRAPSPVHGEASSIEHDGAGVFTGLPSEFRAGRYHSLVAGTVPDCFEVTARTCNGDGSLVMGVRHRDHPLECVMFHPESVLTPVGRDLIANVADAASVGFTREVSA